jgi:hypothetical protein
MVAETLPRPGRHHALEIERGVGMERDEEQHDSITGPPEGGNESTTPPGSGERDEDAVEEGEEKLDQAGGGH